jgi:hypothetical protein
MGSQVHEEFNHAPGFGPRRRSHGLEEISDSEVSHSDARLSEEPKNDRIV